METGYLKSVLNGMAPVLDMVPNLLERQLILAGTMARFLNCDSLHDLAQTYDINKDALYASFDAISPPRWLRRLVKKGRERLAIHLRKWHDGDASYKSRHPITLCADDFTRMTRGVLGGWTGLFYSGAAKKVVPGINVEALAAVIGDGKEVIVLAVRLVPPTPEGQGRPPLNHNQWLRKALRELGTSLTTRSTSLMGCPLVVDAAYVSPENVALIHDMGMHMVSRLAANRLVVGDVDGPLKANVGLFAELTAFLHNPPYRELRGEEDVRYQRHTVFVSSLKVDVVMVIFIHDCDLTTFFSTKTSMKTMTLRNILRYRWQLERIFWIMKQDIGVGDIHHKTKERCEARLYLHFLLAQVTRDAAAHFKCSPKDIVRGIRRFPGLTLQGIGFQSTFAWPLPCNSVLNERCAA